MKCDISYIQYIYYIGASRRLLGAQDLHGGARMLRQAHEGARLGDEPRTHELAHHVGEVGRDRGHAQLQHFPSVSSTFLKEFPGRIIIFKGIFSDFHGFAWHFDGVSMLPQLFPMLFIVT